jgi:hypothetical protein
MLMITGFIELNSRMFAAARFVGSGGDANISLAAGEGQGILLPVRIRKATQQFLQMELGPLRLELLESHAELGRATLEIAAWPDPTGQRRSLLDAISYLHFDPTVPLHQLIRLLNELLIAPP